MNELDQFVKHELKIKNYVRYTDDFAIVEKDRKRIEEYLPVIRNFLEKSLAIKLHPRKISVRTLYQGIDFLGYVSFPHHRLVRSKTRRRIQKKMKQRTAAHEKGVITQETLEQSLQSYLGVLSHADTYELSQNLKNFYGLAK
jgi:RNA-directed DNA polymerase